MVFGTSMLTHNPKLLICFKSMKCALINYQINFKSLIRITIGRSLSKTPGE